MKQELIKLIEGIISQTNSSENEILLGLKQIVYTHELKNRKTISQKHYSETLIKSGFANFDIKFGGFSLGEFVIVGGRPSMGKTQLLVSLCRNLLPELSIAYFTFDLSRAQLTNRFFSSFSNIPIDQILQNNLNKSEKANLHALEKESGMANLFIDGNGYSTISDFKEKCLAYISENGVKIVIVDDLQNMKPRIINKKNKAQLSVITNELKCFAKDHSILLIATSQLNRAVEIRGGDCRPKLADLCDSGSIEEDSDKVIFIYRPEYYNISVSEDGTETAGIIELIMAKNKNGKVGTVKLYRNVNLIAYT